MKLNKLISKYLDGELSKSEDSILRNGLKHDSNLKQSFDKYVDIHHEMKKEASSIKVPAHLFASTEQFTLGRQQLKQNIETSLSSNNATIKSVAKSKSYRKAFATTMLLMLISIYNISDNYKANYIDFSGLNSNLQTESFEKQLKANKARKYSQKSVLNQLENNGSNLIDEANLSELNQIPNVISFSMESNLENDKLEINSFTDLNTGNKNNNNTIVSDKVSVYNSLNKTNSIISNQANQFNNPSNLQGIQNSIDLQYIIKHQNMSLQSTFANSTSAINIGNANDVKISSFIQSINYEVNSGMNMGMEVGYSNYDFTTQLLTNVSISTGGESNSGKGGKIEVLDPTKSIVSKIKVKLNINQNYQQMFASFFLDKTIIKEDNFSANARIGLGSSMDGLLLYGRASANYQIFSNLTANVGAEIRMFNVNLPNATAGISKTVNTLMLTYGLQYSL